MRILIIEDDFIISRVLVRECRKRNHRAYTVDTAWWRHHVCAVPRMEAAVAKVIPLAPYRARALRMHGGGQ